MRYHYLLVDNDNTLMDFNAAERKSLRETLTSAGLPADDAVCALYHEINDALWKALERGKMTQPRLKVERFARLLARLGRTDKFPEELAAAYAGHLATHGDVLPGAEAFLAALHGRMKIALVSNGISAIQHGRLSRCAFAPLLDAVIISEEVGAAKPDPRMVELALTRLGCADKADAVLMGDSLTADIPAAVNAGVDSIYFSPNGKKSETATYTVHSYAEALDILLGEK